jgi:predicted Fe-Mo cluster-binding NifX family protein
MNMKSHKLALPVFEERVSPRFDCAPVFLLIDDTIESAAERRTCYATGGMGVCARVRLLQSMAVDVLICGGIDGKSMRLLEQASIEVYPWVTGEVEDALLCYRNGELERGIMVGRGGRCCGRWRFRGDCDAISET